jgi:hypothetical protein
MKVVELIEHLRQFDGQLPVFVQLPDGICTEPIAHPMPFLDLNGRVVARPPELRMPNTYPGVLVSPSSPDD